METTTQKSVTPGQSIPIDYSDFGHGRFSPAMKELYQDAIRLLGFTEKQAHVTAKQFGVDCGQLTKGQVTVKFGESVSKDGKRTLKEITEGIKVSNTWAMSIGTVCAQLDKTRKNGLVVNDVTMTPAIMSQVDEHASRLA